MVEALSRDFELYRDAPFDTRNTLALPCTVAAHLQIPDASAVSAALDWCAEAELRPLPLGEGSNVILPPRLERAVLTSNDCRVDVLERTVGSVLLRVGAGHNWHRLVADCLARGFYGLENLALIPGTTGAAPVQNIGAYGVELARFVRAVHAVDLLDGSPLELSSGECAFSYRDSVFKGALRDRCLITAVDLRLSLEPDVCLDYPALADRVSALGLPPDPRAVFDTVVALRRERLPDPERAPNAGSFFQNPMLPAARAQALRVRYPELPVFDAGEGLCKLSAAWMIDRCGFRGMRSGPVAVAAEHALVLVNRGGDRDALLTLAERVRQGVQERFGCRLELEPTVIDHE